MPYKCKILNFQTVQGNLFYRYIINKYIKIDENLQIIRILETLNKYYFFKNKHRINCFIFQQYFNTPILKSIKYIIVLPKDNKYNKIMELWQTNIFVFYEKKNEITQVYYIHQNLK